MGELNAAYVEAVHGLTELWRTGIIPPSLRRIIYGLDDGTDEGRRVQTALEIVMSDLDKYRHMKYSFASEQAFATHLTDRIILIIHMARKDAQIDAEKA